ncbi:DNA polymerase Y family protein [Sphingomonas koreensis]|nr:DNA polymerase Y family protein [Sphingomonas koreensis]
MRRVASLYLPQLPIERLRRVERPRARPEPPLPLLAVVDDDPGPCSVPRGGGWRPGARWAQDGRPSSAELAAGIESLPSHRRPPARELGRRSEAADHPFRAMRPDDGARSAAHHVVPPVPGSAQPLVLAATLSGRQLVSAACPEAFALGLAPGMALTQARALVPDLDMRPADPAADAALLERLAAHAARHWTPNAAATADGLWLDLTGTSHLFGGEERFCRLVLRFLGRLGLSGRIAVADTPGAAHAVSRHGAVGLAIVPPGTTVQAIAPLPVTALRLEPAALAACRRFGIERIADLIPMPRGPLARRLGRGAITRLDQAIGRLAEPIEPKVLEETPVAERRLLEPVCTPEAIGQVMADLVGDLVDVLRTRGLGARSLRLILSRVDGADQCVVVGTAKATREAPHLTRLLHLRMDTVEPGLGIEVARLIATRSEPLGATALAASLAGDLAAPDLAPLVDQLAGRVGEDAIFRTALVESDVPERAVRRVGALAETRGWPAWRRPVRMLGRPEPLLNVVALLPDHPPRRFSWRGSAHVVVSGDGPERIHGEWWVRNGEVWVVRDYFRVEDEGGGRFWLFRRGDGVDGDTGDLSWWMHGFG